MLPAAVEAMTARLGPATPTPFTPPAAPRPPGGGGVPRADRRGAGSPALGGGLHLRRDRERQPGGQGPVLGPPRRRPAAAADAGGAVEHHAVLDPLSWLEEHEGAEIDWLPVDTLGRVHPDTLRDAIERDPRLRGPGHGGCGRTTRSARSSRSTNWPRSPHEYGIPMHSDAVQAVGALEVDWGAPRGRRDDLHRAQDRRPDAASAPCSWAARRRRSRCCTAAARNATSAPAPWTPRPSPASRPRWWRRCRQAEQLGPADRAARRPDRPGPPAVPDVVVKRRPRPRHRPARHREHDLPRLRGRLPADAAGRPAAWSARPARPARPASPSPATCCWRWAWTASRARGSLRFSLGHTSTKADVDALAEAIGLVVDGRAGRAELIRADGCAVP